MANKGILNALLSGIKEDNRATLIGVLSNGIRDITEDKDKLYERMENKVQEINKESSPEQYPSAAAVYEAIKNFSPNSGGEGLGIKKIEINELGELEVTYSNDEVINLGKIVGDKGESITITKTIVSEKDGGENTIVFSDGSQIVIKNGNKGSDGQDAFEIAQESGFEGTREEWLASLEGEPGESGIYYGTIEPTDPNVNVWINPEVESDDIESALDAIIEIQNSLIGGVAE